MDDVQELLEEAAALLDEGEAEEALDLCALARQRADAGLAGEIALLEASAHNALGDGAAALAAAAEAEQALGADPDVLFEKGVALFELCRFGEARDALSAARRQAADDPWILYHLGLALERCGEAGRALALLERACALAPEDFPPPVALTPEEFDAAIRDAVARLPDDIRRHLDTVAIAVKDLPDEEDLRSHPSDHPLSPGSLGLFRGRTLREPAASGDLPPVIQLFQKNLQRFARDRDELVEQIRVTVLHEVGHYLGFDEDDLHERGLG